MASKLRNLYRGMTRREPSSTVNDPPPAYTATAQPAPQPAPVTTSSGPSNVNTADSDPFSFLSKFDTVFLIDDSTSMLMGSVDACSRSTRWDEVKDVLKAVAPICTKYDDNGIDVYFLNHKTSPYHHVAPGGKAPGGYYNIKDAASVTRIFGSVNARGLTPTGARLEAILEPYMARLRAAASPQDVKPLNLIVITDGSPSDDPAGVLIQIARQLDELRAPASQLGVQFFQVGRDEAARMALEELDDGLAKHCGRDIVDTVTWDAVSRDGHPVLTAEWLLKVLLGAVCRRLDWKRGRSCWLR